MSRIRYDNALGTLGAPLAGGEGTSTIHFQSAPQFATIVPPNYIALVLEPPTTSTPASNYEVVYLTAYTSGATSGTVTRARDGTTAQPHAATVPWVCGPITSDFGLFAQLTGDPSDDVFAIAAGSGGKLAVVVAGSAVNFAVRIAAAGYSVLANDAVVMLDATSAGFSVTLPAATGSGRYLAWRAINTNSNFVTVTPFGSDTIDAAANTTIGPAASIASWQALEIVDTATGQWRSL